jgi:hypothetical protein
VKNGTALSVMVRSPTAGLFWSIAIAPNYPKSPDLSIG